VDVTGTGTTGEEDVLFRVNAGGEMLAGLDGAPDWSADSASVPYPGHNAGSETVNGKNVAALAASVPTDTPVEVFQSERWDAGSAPEMNWAFPVAAGTEVEVRLYFANGWSGTSSRGQRVFDVAIDGVRVLNDYDIAGEVGHQTGTMKRFLVTSDGMIDIEFLHKVENPLINAIEIVRTKPSPTALSVSPSSLNFNSVAVGDSASATITLTNTGIDGDPDIAIGDILLAGDPALTLISTPGLPYTLVPGQSVDVGLAFTPTVAGTASAALTVIHNGASSPLDIVVSGLGDDVLGASPGEPTLSISATPSSISFNGSAALTWVSTDASLCEASGGWSGFRATSGSAIVGPLVTTSTFNLSCDGPGGSTSDSVTVTVEPASAPTVSLTADPNKVSYDGSSTLNWFSTNAHSCTASGVWSGIKGASGRESVGPLAETSTFALNCSGPGGSVDQSVTVTVEAPPPLPSMSLTADPTSVSANGFSTLSWSTTNATSCNGGGAWSGSKATAGSQGVGPLADTSVFTLACSGPGGSANRPVTVTVEAANGTADLSWIAPQTNEDGSPVNLTGFNIYQGSSVTSLSKIATVGASTTTFTATNLPAGTQYFAVTAVGGGESQFSNVENKTIF
jgi:hypothetical protein